MFSLQKSTFSLLFQPEDEHFINFFLFLTDSGFHYKEVLVGIKLNKRHFILGHSKRVANFNPFRRGYYNPVRISWRVLQTVMGDKSG